MRYASLLRFIFSLSLILFILKIAERWTVVFIRSAYRTPAQTYLRNLRATLFKWSKDMSDYANYISAKHKTDSAISYSHYTRFYAHISRVCTPAKTRGFSSSIRNKEELRKGGNSQVPHPSPKWREVSRQSRETAKGMEYPPTTSFIRPHNPRT